MNQGMNNTYWHTKTYLVSYLPLLTELPLGPFIFKKVWGIDFHVYQPNLDHTESEFDRI